MSDIPLDPPHWDRPHWTDSGMRARLWFVVVGDFSADRLQVSRSRHHVDAMEEEFSLTTHRRAENPEWFDNWFSLPGSYFEETFGDQSDAIQGASQLTRISGELADRDSLDYLRNAIGMVSAVLESGGLGVLDVFALTWWTPEQWFESFVDYCQFEIQEQVGLVISEDDRFAPGCWMHTRGMVKFARPDLHIKHVSDTDPRVVQAAANVLNSIAEYLAKGAVIDDGQTMSLGENLPEVTFVESPDDSECDEPHFNNAALEIRDLNEQTGQSESGIMRLLTAIG